METRVISMYLRRMQIWLPRLSNVCGLQGAGTISDFKKWSKIYVPFNSMLWFQSSNCRVWPVKTCLNAKKRSLNHILGVKIGSTELEVWIRNRIQLTQLHADPETKYYTFFTQSTCGSATKIVYNIFNQSSKFSVSLWGVKNCQGHLQP